MGKEDPESQRLAIVPIVENFGRINFSLASSTAPSCIAQIMRAAVCRSHGG